MAYYSTSNDNNRLMFGTPGIVISGTLMLVMAILSFCIMDNTQLSGNQGLCLPSPNLWNINPIIGFVLNIMTIGLCGLILILINKEFNIVRSHTVIFTSSFFVITGCNPWLTGNLNSASIFALLMLVCIHILFKLYGIRNATSGIFMLFSTLAFGTMIQYAFVLMIPIFMIGAMYMNVLRMKEFTAACMGIIAPYWIMLGFGIIDLDDISLPTLTNLFNNLTPSANILWLLIIVGYTFLIALFLAFVNASKVFATGSQIRAYNSFINLLGITLAWYMVFDYTNILVYVTTFNLITGLQIAHFFGQNKINYGYIYYLTGIVLYISLLILIING